jgi:hypothetical protein
VWQGWYDAEPTVTVDVEVVMLVTVACEAVVVGVLKEVNTEVAVLVNVVVGETDDVDVVQHNVTVTFWLELVFGLLS